MTWNPYFVKNCSNDFQYNLSQDPFPDKFSYPNHIRQETDQESLACRLIRQVTIAGKAASPITEKRPNFSSIQDQGVQYPLHTQNIIADADHKSYSSNFINILYPTRQASASTLVKFKDWDHGDYGIFSSRALGLTPGTISISKQKSKNLAINRPDFSFSQEDHIQNNEDKIIGNAHDIEYWNEPRDSECQRKTNDLVQSGTFINQMNSIQSRKIATICHMCRAKNEVQDTHCELCGVWLQTAKRRFDNNPQQEQSKKEEQQQKQQKHQHSETTNLAKDKSNVPCRFNMANKVCPHKRKRGYCMFAHIREDPKTNTPCLFTMKGNACPSQIKRNRKDTKELTSSILDSGELDPIVVSLAKIQETICRRLVRKAISEGAPIRIQLSATAAAVAAAASVFATDIATKANIRLEKLKKKYGSKKFSISKENHKIHSSQLSVCNIDGSEKWYSRECDTHWPKLSTKQFSTQNGRYPPGHMNDTSQSRDSNKYQFKKIHGNHLRPIPCKAELNLNQMQRYQFRQLSAGLHY